MKSIWMETAKIPRRNPLAGNKRTEVVVIGAGMAGMLTAFYLQRHGVHVVVLEANRIGSGQSGYTTAKITSQHNLIYDKLVRTVGKETARLYGKANQLAVEEYGKLIEKYSISCHYEPMDAFLYTLENPQMLKREAETARSLGLPASFVQETKLPFSVTGAVQFTGQAQFNPLEFLRDISNGITVYERTKVIKVEGNQVITDRGAIKGDHVVFASHYPFVNFPGFYFTRMYQEKSYVLELEPVDFPDGMYLGVDKKAYSFRKYGDSLLIGYGSHRTGKAPSESPFKEMRQLGTHFFPQADEQRVWTAQDCMTLDSIPYIGTYSSLRPQWHVATGFGKWGMSSSMVAAKILSMQIIGKKTAFDHVFSPQRHHIKASAYRFAGQSMESVKGLVLAARPGAVRCPHLGCRMVWNKYDKQWECPCHGSGFEINGKISSGPAQQSIPFID
ncbi:FAD-dependent oxidoreductase [Clostridium sp. HBUAS56010]|uniref:FAD-dependent oxidoreductase n=1 Tax=Clostridium sp. HBUAS56010 TaxID=2571127 RepID=UPI0011781CC8|nr:FAD-dependent oxidoreductase [Clostridium sp. HBUAS56010]